MSEEKKTNLAQNAPEPEKKEQYSLNDDRRVKTLSPNAMVMKRFLRNRVAVTGLIILVFMFLFSFVGGMISPYSESQIFYRTEMQSKEYASVLENTNEFRYAVAEDKKFDSFAQGMFIKTVKEGKNTFELMGARYSIREEGPNVYGIYQNKLELIATASYAVVSSSEEGTELPFMLRYEMLKAYSNDLDSFVYEGETYTMDGGTTLDSQGKEIGYTSQYIVKPLMSDIFLSRDFKEELVNAILEGTEEFAFADADGVEAEYTLKYDPQTLRWRVLQDTPTYVFDGYGYPSAEHWLGTDRNGMDMMTRLMYGGRVSLVIGFIVVFIESFLGVILGGIAGYFGKWVDMVIMRAVDVFYCIPSTPILIILGAAMDAMRVDPQIRMLFLMLLLGFLGWAGVARLVRGQILALREQEFMTACEAGGIRASRRIFRHLLPNVIPQLIVNMTMGLGGTILTEATLSFLGLGVKFPFASWGNIINDVNNTYVLTTYWFIWIPAGFCLLLTVLAFNLVGDGLRDAFDPKMKR